MDSAITRIYDVCKNFMKTSENLKSVYEFCWI